VGASAWFAVTPFDDDLARALATAQRIVFETRKFYDPIGIVKNPQGAKKKLAKLDLPSDFPEADARELAEAHEEEVAPLLAAIDDYVAATDDHARIDALRRAVGFEGTHSIIDLESTDRLERVDDEELVRRFGTTTPSLVAVKKAATALESLVRARFRAVWLVAVDGNGARWFCVSGVSGD
jgi:hypothetical protein